MPRVLLNVPKTARRGDPVAIKLLISHPMESGQRRDDQGRPVPRNIIHAFRCTYNGAEVLRLELFPAIAANPFLSFSTVADASGPIVLEWTDDEGATQTESVHLEVA